MSIKVAPSEQTGAIPVLTDNVNGTHTPIYKLGFSAASVAPVQVTTASPFPVFIGGSAGEGVTVEHGAISVATSEHLTTFSEEYTADAGGDVPVTTVITPTLGSKLAVEVLFLATDGASGTIQVDLSASSKKIFRMYPSKNTQSNGTGMHIIGAVNEVLTLQATGIGNGAKFFVIISYVEHT